MTEATTVAELQARIDSALAELDRTAYDMGYLPNRAGDAAANLDRVRRARAALTGRSDEHGAICGDIEPVTGTVCIQVAPHHGTMHGKPGDWWAHARASSSVATVEGDIQEIAPKLDTLPGSVKELEPNDDEPPTLESVRVEWAQAVSGKTWGALYEECLDDFDRMVAAHDADAWDESCKALAWCMDNGADNLQDIIAYVTANNPHRAELRAELVREPSCFANWPECFSGGYDPRCCRFPKSCSVQMVEPVCPAENGSEQS